MPPIENVRPLFPRRVGRQASRVVRRPLSVVAILLLAVPLHAQSTRPLDSGIVVGTDWLQANSLPLDRDALQSGAISIALRRHGWSYSAAWVRIARTLSTVQGAAVSVGPMLYWGPVLFLPSVGALGGQASASRDSTGYDFVGPGGIVGHQPRYSYSSAATAGGNVALTVEVPIYRALAVRGVASQWLFSGAPLEGDRERFLIGAGLSLKVGR